MRQQIEIEEKNLYKPEINIKSKEIVLKKSDRSFNMDIHEKLYRNALNKNTDRRGREMGNTDSEECTFAPHLCYSTMQTGGNIDDFLERQKIYDELKKERLERRLSKSIENNNYTFIPKINITSDILMKVDHKRAHEEIKDKVDRLYKQDFEKIKQRKEQLENF